MATFLKTALVLAITLAIAEVIGVIVCVICGVPPSHGRIGIASYAIWFALGLGTGFIVLTGAGGWIAGDENGDWRTRPDAGLLADRVTRISAALLAGCTVLCYLLLWSRHARGVYFVPDSMPHTTIFLGATLSAMLIGRAMLPPARSGSARG